MSLNRTDPETVRLAQAIAALTGETLATAIRRALTERLDRERSRRDRAAWLEARLRGLGEQCAALNSCAAHPSEPDGYDDVSSLWR